MKNSFFVISAAVLFLNFACKSNEPAPTVLGISLDKTSLSIAEGDSASLSVTFVPKGSGEKIVWTSSNEKVATVTDGKIRAISRGSANIIAISETTKVETNCNVTVTRTDLPYQLVWSDEFDGTTLDQTKWNYETGGGGWGNQEKQYYTNRTDNIRFENGNMVIEAKKEDYNGSAYTSARINSLNKFAFAYGKIEARISLPSGKGTWPAFWMMGANINLAHWPLCGEIDIMEHIGSQPTMISHATHTSEKNGSRGNNWYNRQYPSTAVENNFHTYAIEWEQKYNEGDDNISFYIDGVKSATVWEPHVNSTVQQWPFKSDFFVIFNLAMGGTMGGSIDDAIFAEKVLMKVDYVRVYKRK